MSKLQDVNEGLKKETEFKEVFEDLKLLIRKGIIVKDKVNNIDGYEIVEGRNFVYQMDYKLYFDEIKYKYALISSFSKNGEISGYSIYELDYSDSEVIKEIVGNVKTVVKSSSDNIIITLNILGWLFVIMGMLFSFTAGTDGFLEFMAGIVGGVVTGIVFFALAAIIKHLQSIDDKIKKH